MSQILRFQRLLLIFVHTDVNVPNRKTHFQLFHEWSRWCSGFAKCNIFARRLLRWSYQKWRRWQNFSYRWRSVLVIFQASCHLRCWNEYISSASYVEKRCIFESIVYVVVGDTDFDKGWIEQLTVWIEFEFRDLWNCRFSKPSRKIHKSMEISKIMTN